MIYPFQGSRMQQKGSLINLSIFILGFPFVGWLKYSFLRPRFHCILKFFFVFLFLSSHFELYAQVYSIMPSYADDIVLISC